MANRHREVIVSVIVVAAIAGAFFGGRATKSGPSTESAPRSTATKRTGRWWNPERQLAFCAKGERQLLHQKFWKTSFDERRRCSVKMQRPRSLLVVAALVCFLVASATWVSASRKPTLFSATE